MQEICLANLATKTAQEVFDYVARHLLRQGKKAQTIDCHGTVSCLYRTDEGLRCAAGSLVADEEYQKGFEGYAWGGLVDQGKTVPTVHRHLIKGLQNVHDNYAPDIWGGRLAEVATEHDLDFDENKLRATTPSN